jgi:hypothetical protein
LVAAEEEESELPADWLADLEAVFLKIMED